jgi:hypothetical protein
MQAVFLSFSFREKDATLVRPAVQVLEAVLESFDVRATTGQSLAGAPLTAAIKARIEECSGLIALITPDVKKRNGKFTAHSWSRDELNHARSRNISAIALLHRDVENEGISQDYEYVPWDPRNTAPAIVKIVQTIGQWKRISGKLSKIKIIPENVGFQVAQNGGRCSYRLLREGAATRWLEANVFGEVGGAFAHVSGIQDDALIELKVEIGGERWTSRATPQFLQVELQKVVSP